MNIIQIMTVALPLLGYSAFAQNPTTGGCPNLETEQLVIARKSDSYFLPGGVVVPTTKAREQSIAGILKENREIIYGLGKYKDLTMNDRFAPLQLVPVEGVELKVQINETANDYSIPMTGQLSKVGSDGIFRFTAFFPMSGHWARNASQLDQAAKTDTFNFVITSGQQKVQLSKSVKSLAPTTLGEFEVNLKSLGAKPGDKIVLQYWRDQSAGVGGYRGGRELILQWDGT